MLIGFLVLHTKILFFLKQQISFISVVILPVEYFIFDNENLTMQRSDYHDQNDDDHSQLDSTRTETADTELESDVYAFQDRKAERNKISKRYSSVKGKRVTDIYSSADHPSVGARICPDKRKLPLDIDSSDDIAAASKKKSTSPTENNITIDIESSDDITTSTKGKGQNVSKPSAKSKRKIPKNNCAAEHSKQSNNSSLLARKRNMEKLKKNWDKKSSITPPNTDTENEDWIEDDQENFLITLHEQSVQELTEPKAIRWQMFSDRLLENETEKTAQQCKEQVIILTFILNCKHYKNNRNETQDIKV